MARLKEDYLILAARQKREREEREKANSHRAQEIQDLQETLANRYRLPMDKKFYIAWGIAWEHGHSSGLYEVENFFDSLVPLLKDQ